MSKAVLLNRLSGLYLGSETLLASGSETGIDGKQAVPRLEVLSDAVVGDAQADSRHHGGPDRVLHHFPREHYGQYRRWDLMRDFKDAPAMGENISTVGLDETRVHIGDIIAIGEVELQITQPRSPCFKLNRQFGHREFAMAMQTSGRCGWFYRVLKPGTIHSQDELTLIDRRTNMSVAQAMHIYFLPEFDAGQYDRLASCEGLATAWVTGLRRRLQNRAIEDWQMRLYGL